MIYFLQQNFIVLICQSYRRQIIPLMSMKKSTRPSVFRLDFFLAALACLSIKESSPNHYHKVKYEEKQRCLNEL